MQIQIHIWTSKRSFGAPRWSKSVWIRDHSALCRSHNGFVDRNGPHQQTTTDSTKNRNEPQRTAKDRNRDPNELQQTATYHIRPQQTETESNQDHNWPQRTTTDRNGLHKTVKHPQARRENFTRADFPRKNLTRTMCTRPKEKLKKYWDFCIVTYFCNLIFRCASISRLYPCQWVSKPAIHSFGFEIDFKCNKL